MRSHDLNLLPRSAQERIRRSAELRRGSAGAICLLAVAGLAAVGSNINRRDAMWAAEDARQRAAHALAKDDFRSQLESEVRALAARGIARRLREGELPLVSLVGVVAESLHAEATLDRIAMRRTGNRFDGDLVIRGDRAMTELFAEEFGRRGVFDRIHLGETIADGEAYSVRFSVATDRRYSIVRWDSDDRAKEDEVD